MVVISSTNRIHEGQYRFIDVGKAWCCGSVVSDDDRKYSNNLQEESYTE